MTKFNEIAGLVMLSTLFFAAGCATIDDRPPPADFSEYSQSNANQTDPSQGDQAACELGATKKCSVKLASQGTVANCFVGVRYCEPDDDGKAAWGPCEADSASDRKTGASGSTASGQSEPTPVN